jgi:hypothetical protein
LTPASLPPPPPQDLVASYRQGDTASLVQTIAATDRSHRSNPSTARPGSRASSCYSPASTQRSLPSHRSGGGGGNSFSLRGSRQAATSGASSGAVVWMGSCSRGGAVSRLSEGGQMGRGLLLDDDAESVGSAGSSRRSPLAWSGRREM